MSEPLPPALGSVLGFDAAGPDLSAPFLRCGQVTGAAVTVFSGTSAETLLSATDGVARALDEAQFDLGEGPRWDAARTRLPVLLPDLSGSSMSRWPAFGEVLAGLDVAALFVFPLTVGAIDLGVVELYRNIPGPLSGDEMLAVGVLAGETAWTILRGVLGDADPPRSAVLHRSVGSTAGSPSLSAGLPRSRREIHQATGMVLAQANVSAAQALLLLRGYAFSHQQTLHETALRVILRELDFTSPEDPGRA